MFLTLTWCHRTPADTPTRVSSINAISTEHQLDNVACAGYMGRKRGADTLASDQNVDVIRGGAAALLHQGCPVPVRDCQVVEATGGTTVMGFNVKCSEL